MFSFDFVNKKRKENVNPSQYKRSRKKERERESAVIFSLFLAKNFYLELGMYVCLLKNDIFRAVKRNLFHLQMIE